MPFATLLPKVYTEPPEPVIDAGLALKIMVHMRITPPLTTSRPLIPLPPTVESAISSDPVSTL